MKTITLELDYYETKRLLHLLGVAHMNKEAHREDREGAVYWVRNIAILALKLDTPEELLED
jgi:hypothetical protein